MSSPATLDINRGPVVVAILWTETAVAVIIVSMRFYARTIVKRISWDDWLMLVTLVCIVPMSTTSWEDVCLHCILIDRDYSLSVQL